MVRVSCKICRRAFSVKPFFIKKGYGKYCSRKCHHTSMEQREIVSCGICGIKIDKKYSCLKKSKSGKFFCSKSCQTVWRNKMFSGEAHVLWKGGESTYRDKIWRGRGEKMCKRCGLNDKRVLAVHHIDRNRKNSSMDNLVLLCHNCHVLIHKNKTEDRAFMATLV